MHLEYLFNICFKGSIYNPCGNVIPFTACTRSTLFLPRSLIHSYSFTHTHSLVHSNQVYCDSLFAFYLFTLFLCQTCPSLPLPLSSISVSSLSLLPLAASRLTDSFSSCSLIANAICSLDYTCPGVFPLSQYFRMK